MISQHGMFKQTIGHNIGICMVSAMLNVKHFILKKAIASFVSAVCDLYFLVCFHLVLTFF
jgi:hypothetical protein